MFSRTFTCTAMTYQRLSLTKLAPTWKPIVRVLLATFLVAPPLAFILVETILNWRTKAILNLSFSTTNVSNSISSNDYGLDSLCSSRHQQDLLRRPSQIHPLPWEFAAAFAGYQKMHAACYHRRNLTGLLESPDPSDPCKYLVFLQDGQFGLGNHILSLVSAFVYALLTNRMLLVDSRGHLPKLFCEPFFNSSWLLPDDFPYHHLLTAPLGIQQNFQHGNVVHLMLLSVQTPEEQQFFCSDSQLKLQQVRWIGWSSNQYYIPRFFTLPNFWRPLVSIFPDVSMIFTHLSRTLMLPQNHIWERILLFHSTYLAGSSTKLGVQVRTPKRADFYAPAFTRIMDCLVHNKLLPNVSFGSGQPKNLLSAPKTKVLVTSLQERYYEELKSMYTNHATVNNSLVEVHTLSHDGKESQAYVQAVNALVEMWLLSFSDRIVTSSWSTFGYVAQGLGALRPYILNIKWDFEKDKLPWCSLGQSPEPCNQFPFSSVCRRNASDDIEQTEWIQAHIRRCQDEPHGMQLVQQ